MLFIRRMTHRLLRKSGFDILRYNVDNFSSLRRTHILKPLSIDVVFDIGAAEGTYALQIREESYKGRIISFEPLPLAFNILQSRASNDTLWDVKCMAIGDLDGHIDINISANWASSSLLPMSSNHVTALPQASYIAKEKVQISKLDSLSKKLIKSNDRVFLKADVQGFERHVLEGAQETLHQIYAVEIELSLVPLYDGSPPLREMIDYMDNLGFVLVSLENVFTDPATSYLLQVNGIFVRR